MPQVILNLPRPDSSALQEPVTVTIQDYGKDFSVSLTDYAGTHEFQAETLFYKQENGVIEAVIRHNARCYKLFAASTPEKIFLWVDGRHYIFQRHVPPQGGQRKRQTEQGHGGNTVIAPMPGKILQIMVQSGDAVTIGQPVIIMESMKMELTLSASQTGIVTDVRCEPGQKVEMNALLLNISVQAISTQAGQATS